MPSQYAVGGIDLAADGLSDAKYQSAEESSPQTPQAANYDGFEGEYKVI